MTSQSVKVFMGGTFDPVHAGHLRMGLEVAELLDIDNVSLMPCYLPVHRDDPGRSPEHRLSMLESAVADCSRLTVDAREISRKGPSYTVDTLQGIRDEVGSDVSLAIVIGGDTYNKFTSWKRWQEIPELAHLIVVMRPGYELCDLPDIPSVKQLSDSPSSVKENIHQNSSGTINFLSLSLLDISSTEIRQRLEQGKSVKYLLPDAVIDYISSHQLYS